MKKDFYEVLGVSKNADAATIKKTYRKKAIEFTIEFAEWKDKNCIYYDGWNIRIPLGDKYNDVYTNEELLKIFKKEKGL